MAASQARTGNAGKAAIKACSVLPIDVVRKVTGVVNKTVLNFPPTEEAIGASGSSCDYADVLLQVDAFTPAAVDGIAKKDKAWMPVSGTGDRAWFRNNSNNFAEVMGIVGSHTYTIQMSLPLQTAAEKMKPNVITIANAVVAKLK
jgi:hypothetical protein